jgi:hypothetical protein
MMQNRKTYKGPLHTIASGIRNLDIFGQPISLKYKNRTESTSILGGLLSLCFVAGISLYFALLIVQRKNGGSPIVSSNVKKTNLADDPTRSLTLTIDNFDIAIGFLNGGSNSSITPDNINEFFYYNLNMIDYSLTLDTDPANNFGSYKWAKTPVPLVICDETRFKGMTEITANLAITGSMYCPEANFSLTLNGGFTT